MSTLTTLQVQRVARGVLAGYHTNQPPRAHRVIATREPVTDQSGTVFAWTRGDNIQRSAAGTDAASLANLTAPGAAPTRVKSTIGTGSWACHKYRLETAIVDEELRSASRNGVGLISRETTALINRLEADLELLLLRILLDDDTFPTGGKVTLTTGANGTSWAPGSYASASTDPLGVIRAAIDWVRKSTGFEATHMIATSDVIDTLADHPAIGGQLKYTSGEFLTVGTPGQLRSLKVVRMGAVYDSDATTTVTPAYTFRDNDDAASCALICHLSESCPIATWYDGIAPTQGGHDINIRAYRDETAGATIIDAEVYADMALTALDASSKILGGYLVHKAIC